MVEDLECWDAQLLSEFGFPTPLAKDDAPAPSGMVMVPIELLKQLQTCAETARSNYYRSINVQSLPKDSGITEMLRTIAEEHDGRCATVKEMIAAVEAGR